jgi:hypothetical protein
MALSSSPTGFKRTTTDDFLISLGAEKALFTKFLKFYAVSSGKTDF